MKKKRLIPLIVLTIIEFPLVLIYLWAYALIELVNHGLGEKENPLCVGYYPNDSEG